MIIIRGKRDEYLKEAAWFIVIGGGDERREEYSLVRHREH